jgi:hypothetical protein
MSGCHYNTKVKIRSNRGYTEITAPLYDRMVKVMKPDYFVGLTEYPSLMKSHNEAHGVQGQGNKGQTKQQQAKQQKQLQEQKESVQQLGQE